MFKIGNINIKYPFLLAPMAGVTDHPFRVICKEMGASLVYTELQDFKKALPYCQKAVEIQPNHVEAYNNLGNIFKEHREFKKAKKSYQKAIQLQPQSLKAHNNLGNILKELGEFTEAKKSYEKVIQIQP